MLKKEKVKRPAIKLLGLTARTNNKDEMDPSKGKIAALANRYWSEQIANDINHKVNPGITFSAYTEFESDENGEYTYFIGEEVSSFDEQDTDRFSTLTIEPSSYQKFTTEPGQIPMVVIEAWQKIWQMDKTDFEGNRTYITDFELYDERAANPDEAIVDIYIGID